MAGSKSTDKNSVVIDRLIANTEQLEATIEQAVAAIRKRGFQLPIDLGAMARAIRTDLSLLQQTEAESGGAKVRQLEELVRTSAMISSSLELNPVLENVIDTVISLAGAERAYLMLRDQSTGELTVRTARNWDRETLTSASTVFSRSVINTAIQHGTPVLTDNAQADARFQGMESVVMNELRSIMCIPMLLRGKIVGVLYADNRIGVGNFNIDSLPIMAAFANQAAIAIENARLFESVKADLVEAKTEVEKLRIQIDQRRLETQLGEIIETDYFQNLQTIAQNMRNRSGRARSNE